MVMVFFFEGTSIIEVVYFLYRSQDVLQTVKGDRILLTTTDNRSGKVFRRLIRNSKFIGLMIEGKKIDPNTFTRAELQPRTLAFHAMLYTS